MRRITERMPLERIMSRTKTPALAPCPCSTSGFNCRIRRETHPRQHVRRRRLAVNGNAMNPKFQLGSEFGQRLLGVFAAGEAVGENADMVAAIGLSMGEIEDVTENPADRRAYRMQNTKRLVVDAAPWSRPVSADKDGVAGADAGRKSPRRRHRGGHGIGRRINVVSRLRDRRLHAARQRTRRADTR